MFPAKIIFHQPQQQKKRGPPKKSFAHGLRLSPTKFSESRGASTSENLSKKSRGRPQGFGEKNRPKNLVNHEDSSAGGDFTGISSSKIQGKKPFGRPLCSGNKQKEEALGKLITFSKQGPQRWVVCISATGVDVVGKLITFLQQGPRPWALSIISATGVICSVKLRESVIGGGTVTYEGQYDIISLSGSLLLPDNNDSFGITGGLSVLLSRPDGSNICGIVAEMLKASSRVELVVGSYIPEKEKPMPEEPSSTC
ncbi:AT-hook motif nuclear-localized protein 10-like [Solanum tuberosum]|uniref:AT-hook motif nuclear-localized protein 10-like n=1 Tax=Solanum tuberosum TaxID=4113 RepID=UPI00073A345E|nr:PREDICTED: AT-hook motif nuclear-localized protein 10-like [Solanum tuberosum]